MIEERWEGVAERIRRVPCDEEWRRRREEISLWSARPDERIVSPPLVSSVRRSEIMCS